MHTVHLNEAKCKPITGWGVIGFCAIILFGVVAATYGVPFFIDRTPTIEEVTVDQNEALFIATAPVFWREGLDLDAKEDELFGLAYQSISRETIDRKRSTVAIDTLSNDSPKFVILRVSWKIVD